MRFRLTNMEGNNLASQEHWDESYKDLTFFKPSFSDPIRRIIKAYAPALGANRSVFEVGCFPGRYLSVFGDLGYSLNGIDLTPRVLTDMPRWLAANGYKIGDFYCDDFFKLEAGKTYDIVCSFGFIEHFVNYDEVLRRHLSFISPGGMLIMTTPNFRGSFQKMLHSHLDSGNLERHYLPSMNPAAWKKILVDSGYEVLFSGFKGGFDFWAESESKSTLKKALIRLLNLSGKILRFLPFNSVSFSPYAVIIAKNKNL